MRNHTPQVNHDTAVVISIAAKREEPFFTVTVCGLMLVTALLILAAAPASNPSDLPLKKVVLYENGLGYFERRGNVPPATTITIPLEANQLDDALKSLVVMSSKFVESVGFEPPVAASAAEEIVGVGNENPPSTVAELVRVLKGADVSVTTHDGKERKGRIFDVVEEEQHLAKDQTVMEPMLVLAGEAGLQRVAVKDVTAVRPLDARVRNAWERATIARSKFGNRDAMTIQGPREGGEISVGYTTEAPVWKVTYRMVMDSKRARMQGFALVHNDSDDGWKNVDITLASGKPNSFVVPMAGPRYSHRELVNVDDGLEVAPQLISQETREHLRGPAVTGFSGLGTRGSGSGGGGSVGYGSGSGSLHGGGGRGVGIASIDGVGTENLSTNPAAAVSEAGDLWLYKVLTPVSIPARRSALVPFVDSTMNAERVAVVNRGGEVQTGVRLTNSTPNTLEAGTMSLFVDGAFDGETNIDRIKPSEVRVIVHGVDMDVTAARSSNLVRTEASEVVVQHLDNPLLIVKIKQRDTHEIVIESHSARPRTLMVELNDQSYKLISGATEEARSPGQPRYARLTLPPKKTQTFALAEEALVRRRYHANDLSQAEMKELLAIATPESKALLTTVSAAVDKATNARRLQAEVDVKLRALDAENARLKELMTASKGAPEAAEKAGKAMLEVEAKRKALITERDNLNDSAQFVASTLKTLVQKQLSAR